MKFLFIYVSLIKNISLDPLSKFASRGRIFDEEDTFPSGKFEFNRTLTIEEHREQKVSSSMATASESYEYNGSIVDDSPMMVDAKMLLADTACPPPPLTEKIHPAIWPTRRHFLGETFTDDVTREVSNCDREM